MYFGSGSEVSGDDVVSTTLAPKEDKTLYYVTLEGINIGDKFLPYDSSKTILPQDFHDGLEQEVKNSIQLPSYQDPELGTQLCYISNTTINAPILTAHFKGSAQMPLVPTSSFIPPKQHYKILLFPPK